MAESRGRGDSSAAGKLAVRWGLAASALGLVWVIATRSPDQAINGLLFFGLLGLFLFCLGTLGLYYLSLVLFSRGELSGNFARASQGGLLLALAGVSLGVLQLFRTLNPLSLGLVLLGLIVLQLLVLRRR